MIFTRFFTTTRALFWMQKIYGMFNKVQETEIEIELD